MNYGGIAGFNSVTYYTDNFAVKAGNDGQISVKDNRKSIFLKMDKYLMKIPLFRGIWVILSLLLKQWKFGSIIILTQLILFFLDQTSLEINSIHIKYRYLFLFVLLIFFVFRLTNLGKYHAAEHMVANAYDNNKELTIKNIKYQSRVHQNCGTNLAVFFPIVFFILLQIQFFNEIHGYIQMILVWSLSFEIYVIENRYVRLLLKPFYWLGYLSQYFLVTVKPDEKHLQVALNSFNKLLKLEKTATNC